MTRVVSREEARPSRPGSCGFVRGYFSGGRPVYRWIVDNACSTSVRCPRGVAFVVDMAAEIDEIRRCPLDLPVRLVTALPGVPAGAGTLFVPFPIPPAISPDFALYLQWIELNSTVVFPLDISEAGAIQVPCGQ